MSLKVVNPIDVTEAVLTASGIPEPDASVGEVLWRDRTQTIPITSVHGKKYASVTANDFTYLIGDFGSVIKVDVANGVATSFGSHTGKVLAAVYTGGDFIYAAGNLGSILKIDIVNETLSTLGTGIQNIACLHYHTNGFIYGGGDGSPTTNGEVIKIDTSSDTISTFGSYETIRTGISGYSDQFLYSVGGGLDVIKIDVVNETLSTITSQSLNLQQIAKGEDGNMYCVGDNSVVTKINTASDTFSYFGKLNEGMTDMTRIGGKLYACSFLGGVYEIDYANNKTSLYRPVTGTLRSIASNGLYMTVGTDGAAIKIIDRGYIKNEEVILTDTHRRYRCLVNETFSNPKDTATGDAAAEWIDIGSTNKWKMFNGIRQTKTTSTDQFTVTLEPVTYVNTLAALAISGVTSIRVEVDNTGGTTIYDKTFTTSDFSAIYDHYTYVFYQIAVQQRLVIEDLPPLPNSTIRVTFNGLNIAIGELVHGFAINVGELVAEDTKSDRFRFREQAFDDFGYPTGPKPITVELNTYDVLVPKLNNPAIQSLLDKITGENTLWIGDIGGGQKLTTYGFFERSPIPFDMPNDINYQITVRASV